MLCPTDKSVGYYHSSARPTLELRVALSASSHEGQEHAKENTASRLVVGGADWVGVIGDVTVDQADRSAN